MTERKGQSCCKMVKEKYNEWCKDGFIVAIVICTFLAIILVISAIIIVPTRFHLIIASSITICAAFIAFFGVQRSANENRKTVLETTLSRYAAIAYNIKYKTQETEELLEGINHLIRRNSRPDSQAKRRMTDPIVKIIDDAMNEINNASPKSAQKCIEFCTKLDELRFTILHFSGPSENNIEEKIVESQNAFQEFLSELDRDIIAGHHAASRLRLR